MENDVIAGLRGQLEERDGTVRRQSAEIEELREKKTINHVDDAVRRNYVASVIDAADARDSLNKKDKQLTALTLELEQLKTRANRVKELEGKLERLCTKLRYLVRAGAAYQALTDKTVLTTISEHPELKEAQDKLLYIIRAGTAYQTVADRTIEELIAAEEKAKDHAGLPVIDETAADANPVNE